MKQAILGLQKHPPVFSDLQALQAPELGGVSIAFLIVFPKKEVSAFPFTIYDGPDNDSANIDTNSIFPIQADRSDGFLKQIRGASLENTVSLVAGEGTYRYLIGDVLSKFLKKTKNKIAIQIGDAEQVVNSVVPGRAQLGIAPHHANQSSLKLNNYSYKKDRKLRL